MNARDNQAWVAMRMIGDAVNRARTADVKAVRGAHAGGGFRGRGLQGSGADAAAVEPAASPADPPDRRPGHGFGVSPGGFPAPGLRTRYAWPRPAGDQMHSSIDPLRSGPRRLRAVSDAEPRQYRLRQQREGQLDLGDRHRDARGEKDGQGRSASARDRAVERRFRALRLRRRRRHDPGHRHQDHDGRRRAAVRPRSRAIAGEPGRDPGVRR